MHSAPVVELEATYEDATDSPPAAPAATGRRPSYDFGELSIENQVQHGLNLFLPLKNPAQFPALGAALAAKMPDVQAALKSLHYVHFARFVPTPDYSQLIVITEYDGDLKSYVMDFVAVLGDVFNTILEFVQGAPPLPVQLFPNEFWQFVQAHNVQADPWSAYPLMTVIDILRARRPR